jgi:hypothetical protein
LAKQSTNDPKLNGSDQAAAGTGRKLLKVKKVLIFKAECLKIFISKDLTNFKICLKSIF